jgi:predicted dehydrogenase
VVGFGLAGRIFHARVIEAVEGLELAAVVERSGEQARALFPAARLCRSLGELLEDRSIRLVAIATPNDSHAGLAREALEAGRDVIIDKPFALTTAEADELIELAARQGRLLSVYQNRRWDGDFLTLCGMLGEGRLGRVVEFETHFDRFRPALRPGAWRESGRPGAGVLYDLAPHLGDQAFLLFGTPRSVWASVRRERPQSPSADAFDIFLAYEHMSARLSVSLMAAAPGPRYVVRGTAGTFVKHGLDPQEEALRAGNFFGPGWGLEPEARWGTFTPGDGTAPLRVPAIAGDYRRYYENVRDALLGKAALAVTPAQARRTIRLIELATLSSESGCALPWS